MAPIGKGRRSCLPDLRNGHKVQCVGVGINWILKCLTSWPVGFQRDETLVRSGRHCQAIHQRPSILRTWVLLKSAGLVTERRDTNRIYCSLVEDRLSASVGQFVSVVRPEQGVMRRRRKVEPR